MLTARHVLTATLVIAALSLVGMGISLWQALRPSQLGSDSYGTRAHGTRGMFDLLNALKIPAERSLLPPNLSENRPRTLVLWGPHRSLAQLEPIYLQRIAGWVQAGGRMVMALPRPDAGEVFSMANTMNKSKCKVKCQFSILDELGLPKVRTSLVDLDALAAAPDANGKTASINPAGGKQAAETPPDGPAHDSAPATSERPPAKPAADFFTPRDSITARMQVFCGGDLIDWQKFVAELEVPQHQVQVLDTAHDKPAGWLIVKAQDGSEQTLAASYRSGKGEILLVSDPELLENRLLGQADNSLLAWQLFVAGNRAVVWDEFYHGLTIRSNPLYLLRREPFGALMAAILILIAAYVWRQTVRFGPPVVVPPTPRRTLAEYVETMARLFQRGERTRPFLLSEMRSGTLWSLRSALGLNLGQEQLENITAVLRRRRPEQAVRLTEAIREIDRALATDREPAEKETVLTLQRISACL